MKIKIIWGFEGDAAKLGLNSGRTRGGQVVDDAEDEYAHVLIGKGLAEEYVAPKPAKGKAAAAATTGDAGAASGTGDASGASVKTGDDKTVAADATKQTGPTENK